MATIFDKFSSGFSGVFLDRLVILNPREALVYPFDFGSDWTELRFGVALSATTASDSNAPHVEEQIGANVLKNSTFLGFLGWTGDLNNFYDIPKVSGSLNGSTYIGQSNYFIGGGTESRAQMYKTASAVNAFGSNPGGGTADGKTAPMFISSSGLSWTLGVSSNQFSAFLPSGNNSTGASSFAALNVCRLIIDSQNRFTFGYPSNTNTSWGNATSTPTVEMVRQSMAVLGLTNLINTTGYWTHNGYNTGIAEAKPKGILIYSPFYNNRIRVHAFVVEKYA